MIVGTRGSKLATVQTDYINKELSKITDETIQVNIIKTKGDKITSSQLYNMDSKGLFTKELDRAVLDEEVDYAVHSLKDVPSELDSDLIIGAVPRRESPHEVLISNKSWADLEEGSTLGTSSLRREAFCKFHQKKLELVPIRGNIETRINKVLNNECDATLMAEAGLNRLGLSDHIKQRFSLEYLTPPAGQGALAVIMRRDSPKLDIIKKLNHYDSYQEILCERTILEKLGVGCQVPLGVIARANQDKLKIYAILLNTNGDIVSKKELIGPITEAQNLGKEVAKYMEEYI